MVYLLYCSATFGYLLHMFYFLFIQTIFEVAIILEVQVVKLPQHHRQMLSIAVNDIAFGLVVYFELQFFKSLHQRKNTSFRPFQLYSLPDT